MERRARGPAASGRAPRRRWLGARRVRALTARERRRRRSSSTRPTRGLRAVGRARSCVEPARDRAARHAHAAPGPRSRPRGRRARPRRAHAAARVRERAPRGRACCRAPIRPGRRAGRAPRASTIACARARTLGVSLTARDRPRARDPGDRTRRAEGLLLMRAPRSVRVLAARRRRCSLARRGVARRRRGSTIAAPCCRRARSSGLAGGALRAPRDSHRAPSPCSEDWSRGCRTRAISTRAPAPRGRTTTRLTGRDPRGSALPAARDPARTPRRRGFGAAARALWASARRAWASPAGVGEAIERAVREARGSGPSLRLARGGALGAGQRRPCPLSLTARSVRASRSPGVRFEGLGGSRAAARSSARSGRSRAFRTSRRRGRGRTRAAAVSSVSSATSGSKGSEGEADWSRAQLVYRVEEPRYNRFEGSVGVQGDAGTVGLVRLDMDNLLGTGRALGLSWESRGRGVAHLGGRYAEPLMFGMPLRLEGALRAAGPGHAVRAHPLGATRAVRGLGPGTARGRLRAGARGPGASPGRARRAPDHALRPGARHLRARRRPAPRLARADRGLPDLQARAPAAGGQAQGPGERGRSCAASGAFRSRGRAGSGSRSSRPGASAPSACCRSSSAIRSAERRSLRGYDEEAFRVDRYALARLEWRWFLGAGYAAGVPVLGPCHRRHAGARCPTGGDRFERLDRDGIGFGFRIEAAGGLVGLDYGLAAGPPAARGQDPSAVDLRILRDRIDEVFGSGAELLAPGGRLAGRWKGYEDRDAQRALAGEIADDHRARRRAARRGADRARQVARLPLARGAARGRDAAQRVVIATCTRSLQDQLYERDLPALLESARHAICPSFASRASRTISARTCSSWRSARGAEEEAVLDRLRRWADTDPEGDLDRFPAQDAEAFRRLRGRVGADPTACTLPTCRRGRECFWVRARRQAAQAARAGREPRAARALGRGRGSAARLRRPDRRRGASARGRAARPARALGVAPSLRGGAAAGRKRPPRARREAVVSRRDSALRAAALFARPARRVAERGARAPRAAA